MSISSSSGLKYLNPGKWYEMDNTDYPCDATGISQSVHLEWKPQPRTQPKTQTREKIWNAHHGSMRSLQEKNTNVMQKVIESRWKQARLSRKPPSKIETIF